MGFACLARHIVEAAGYAALATGEPGDLQRLIEKRRAPQPMLETSAGPSIRSCAKLGFSEFSVSNIGASASRLEKALHGVWRISLNRSI